MNNKNEVAIIGAGPAGLTAGYFLLGKNICPVIYEAGKETGGLAGSVTLWGKNYDIGPHIFIESSQPDAVRFWKEIGGNDLVRMTLSRGMVLKGKVLDFPPKPMKLLGALGFFTSCVAASSLIKARLAGKKDFTHAGSFFRNRFGESFRKILFNPFCEKYMGNPDSKVSLDFATGLTSFVKESGKNDVNTNEQMLKSLIYPKQGTKMIWSKIADKILQKGEIRFNKRLSRIVTEGKRVSKLGFTDGTECEPAFVVSSLPIVPFLNLIDNCPADVRDAASKLRSRNTVLVYLRVSGKSFGYHYATAFDHSVEAGRISNFNKWKPDSFNNETVLCIEYWCSAQDVNWTCTSDKIIAKAVDEMHRTGFADKNKITGAEVIRIPHSHPILDTECSAALSKINQYLSGFENLALAGRHATFKWDGQADNIVAGMHLAERISATV